MTLVRCHGDHAVAAFTIAAVSNAVAENDKHTQQRRLLILLTILRGVDQQPCAHAKSLKKS
jgi:hypothetical protein